MRKEIHRMQLRYEQLRKKQEEMIKDMERANFQPEPIQLKYLPTVQKKNAEDRCKLSFWSLMELCSIARQIVQTGC